MRFIVLGDLHYCRTEEGAARERRDRFFGSLLERVAASRPDRVLGTGDIVHAGTNEEYADFQRLLADRGIPFLFAFGNHDLLALSAVEVSLRFDRTPYFSFDQEGFRFIVLNSSRDVSPQDWGGAIDDTQLHWLRRTLASLDELVPVVIAHHPLPATTRDSHGAMMSIANGEHVWEALRAVDDRPALFFCGHTHVLSSIDRDNWRLVQTGAATQVLTYHVVESSEDGIEVRTVTIADEDLAELGKSVDSDIPRMHRPPYAVGDPQERATVRMAVPRIT